MSNSILISEPELWAICKKEAPKQGLEPSLLMAVCMQEAAREGASFVVDSLRLEQGFYNRYMRASGYDPVLKILLSSSYGLTQMMGESLRELGMITVDGVMAAEFLNQYCMNPGYQVEAGARWLKRKIDGAGGNIKRGLLNWNGGGMPSYPDSVLLKQSDVQNRLS